MTAPEPNVHHDFVSAKEDGSDATQVQPSAWDAPHIIDDKSISTDALLLGTTATVVGGAGGAVALPATPLGYVQVALAGGGYAVVPFYPAHVDAADPDHFGAIVNDAETIDVPLPDNAVAGHLAMIFGCSYAGVPTPPSGWTAIIDDTTGYCNLFAWVKNAQLTSDDITAGVVALDGTNVSGVALEMMTFANATSVLACFGKGGSFTTASGIAGSNYNPGSVPIVVACCTIGALTATSAPTMANVEVSEWTQGPNSTGAGLCAWVGSAIATPADSSDFSISASGPSGARSGIMGFIVDCG